MLNQAVPIGRQVQHDSDATLSAATLFSYLTTF